MHVPNHLVSPEVAIIGGAVAVTLAAVAIKKVKNDTTARERLPLAGVLGLFVLALQMFNYPLAEIGCSGHLVGGVLLAALLGKWLGFLTLTSVIAIQAILLGDGGVMALGLNVLTMAALGALVVYPLVFKPISKAGTSPLRTFSATLASSTVAVALGAMGVVLGTSLSGISALPAGEFMSHMLPVHILIGLVEGIVAGTILALIAARQPAMLDCYRVRGKSLQVSRKGAIVGFALSALLIGVGAPMLASSLPDGMEWSIEKTIQDSGVLPTDSSVE